MPSPRHVSMHFPLLLSSPPFLLIQLLLFSSLALSIRSSSSPSFTIANNSFQKDGQPFRILSCSLHYHRIPSSYWSDRLLRVKAMGLNAIQTYVPWNYHNPSPGVYNFTHDRDLGNWLDLAHSHGLVVLLRAGPYICGEWEFGGFPAWLLALEPPVTLRTYEEGYIREVTTWWSTLFTQVVKPRLYSTGGGPIVMLQVENEFGSYGDVSQNAKDLQYIEELVSLARLHLGNDIVLYTTDGCDLSYMTRGSLPGAAVYSVGDYGPGGSPAECFAAEQKMNAPGLSPPMNSEYYSGWLTHYGESIANTSTTDYATGLDDLLSYNNASSVSIYMGHGGTNYGFYNGANTGGGETDYQPTITSYDYNAPINERGAHGYGSDGLDKFEYTRNVIRKYVPEIPPEPAENPIYAYGVVELGKTYGLWDNLERLSPHPFVGMKETVSMEKLGQSYGFVLYRTVLPPTNPTFTSVTDTITIDRVRDRAQVFINGVFVGTLYRRDPSSSLPMPFALKAGDRLDVLLENMGRVNYGPYLTDPKGIGDVKWSALAIALTNWTIYPLPLEYGLPLTDLKVEQQQQQSPVFYVGSLQIDTTKAPMADTYVNTRGWSKGVVWVNGFNLGRYWETQGPQHALYLPRSVLFSQNNINGNIQTTTTASVVLFELETPRTDNTVTFTAQPDFQP